MNAEQVFVEVRVEPCRINVQDFSLTFQDSENSLNAVQLFTMTQICVDQQIVQHFDQIREEFDVDGVGKPRTIFLKIVYYLSIPETYLESPSRVQLSSLEFGAVFNIRKNIVKTSFVISVSFFIWTCLLSSAFVSNSSFSSSASFFFRLRS